MKKQKQRKKQKKNSVPAKTLILIVCMVMGLFLSCGKSEKEDNPSQNTGKVSESALEQRQQAIATEIVTEMKRPIDMAKGIAEKEAKRIESQAQEENQ